MNPIVPDLSQGFLPPRLSRIERRIFSKSNFRTFFSVFLVRMKGLRASCPQNGSGLEPEIVTFTFDAELDSSIVSVLGISSVSIVTYLVFFGGFFRLFLT